MSPTANSSCNESSAPFRGYSNYLRVGSNAFEFVLEFCDYREGDQDQKSVAVILTSPVFAKAFSEVLKTSVEEYEQRFGAIPDELS